MKALKTCPYPLLWTHGYGTSQYNEAAWKLGWLLVYMEQARKDTPRKLRQYYSYYEYVPGTTMILLVWSCFSAQHFNISVRPGGLSQSFCQFLCFESAADRWLSLAEEVGASAAMKKLWPTEPQQPATAPDVCSLCRSWYL